MIRNKWLVRAAVLAVGALAIPVTAIGAAPSQFKSVSVKVSYADLDIHSDKGARVLYSRLKTASQQACNLNLYIKTSLNERQRARTCYEEALDAAVARVDSSALQQIHTG